MNKKIESKNMQTKPDTVRLEIKKHPNKENVTINILEVASELADHELRTQCKEMIIDETRDGMECYTEEAQDIFNELYDFYYDFLLKYQEG